MLSPMRTFVAILTAAALFTGCTPSDDEMQRTLSDAGYTSIDMHSWAPLVCADDDWGRTFTAKNVNGKRVKGTVCCGVVIKACTIRH